MAGSFGRELEQAIAAAGLSQAQFARAVGCTRGLVGDVIRGRRKIPLHRLPRWAEILHPQAKDRRLAFQRQAALAHCPVLIQEWIGELRSGR